MCYSFAVSVRRVPMAPWFNIAHYALTIFSIRDELQTTG